jgi:outer membrane protein OmpA-like peptidoglycan-associated protein
LRASDRAYLDHVRTLLAGVTSVRCDGFTDSRSTSSYNLGLARVRAVATCAYLLRGTHIRAIVQSYGEAHPHASNTTVDGRARNRRAEIVLEY